ncbi:hypothetical protein [Rhizobium halophilum]|uniref:hypothetical protein n=1 Tax=Rhizobium halophilum TaxID=2846852 RepID=UPI001EFDCB9E|nr:hypothetical protein [Rhizobium halophilum]MCF6370673.1 hypothetical protein [Rhizobium halophilum]
METSNLIVYVPPVLFSLVAGCFFLLWHLKLSDTWYWGAGFAQTALGFVISTFSIQPTFDAFASGLIFMGASYCYGSGLLSHFKMPMQTVQRLSFVALYTLALAYLVFVEKSLILPTVPHGHGVRLPARVGNHQGEATNEWRDRQGPRHDELHRRAGFRVARDLLHVLHGVE